ncbi:MAG: hypothetical protein V4585_11665, partial [Bacteroidota bacterium]
MPYRLMANQRIQMYQVKRIIELTVAKKSKRMIAQVLDISRNTLESYLGESLKFGANFLYYWTYRSFPWSAFLKISLSTPINILKDQILAL